MSYHLKLISSLWLAGIALAQTPGMIKGYPADPQALSDAFNRLAKEHPEEVDTQLRLNGLTTKDAKEQLKATAKSGLLRERFSKSWRARPLPSRSSAARCG